MAKKEKEELLDGTEKKESAGSKIVTFLIALAIVVIWLGVFALLIKLDVGGVGSKVFYPVLKDVPVVNKILPDVGDDSLSLDSEYNFSSMDEAIARIKELEAEVTRLKTFEEEQKDFEKRKLEFDQEVVFSDKSPEIEEYKKYYEEMDPEHAEELYRQVVEQIQADKKITEQSERYANMDPASAAAILDVMASGDLDIVAQILSNMDSDKAALIMAELDSATAAKVTKMMVSGETTEAGN